MSKVINLRQHRKRKKNEEKAKKAKENTVLYGKNSLQKRKEAMEKNKQDRNFSGLKLVDDDLEACHANESEED